LAQVLAPGHERYPRLSFDASAVCSGGGTCAGCPIGWRQQRDDIPMIGRVGASARRDRRSGWGTKKRTSRAPRCGRTPWPPSWPLKDEDGFFVPRHQWPSWPGAAPIAH